MKKTIAIFFASVMLIILFCTPVKAAEQNGRYISNLTFSTDSDNEENGYYVIQEGKIKIKFTRTDSASEAITGIKIFYGHMEENITIDNISYNRIFSINNDNKNNLYVTTDSKAGNPITKLSIDKTLNPEGWYTVCKDDGTQAVSFGLTDEKEDIYLHYERDASFTASAFSSSILLVIILTSIIIVITAVSIAVFVARKFKKLPITKN